MIRLTPYELIDILSAAIQFYERTGLKQKSEMCQRFLKVIQKVNWDEDAELTIDEMPF